MDLRHQVLFSDKMRLVYLQMPRFTKTVDECDTLFDKLIYVLKNMDVLKRMPWLAQEAVFQKIASVADVASLSKQERLAYDESLRRYRDTVAVLEGQYLEGMEKGMEKGKAEAAYRMKTKGYPFEDIADITGLTVDQIAAL